VREGRIYVGQLPDNVSPNILGKTKIFISGIVQRYNHNSISILYGTYTCGLYVEICIV
jgi:hypothetical protein